MMGLGDIAAKLPWPVFACGKDKRPVVATGFKAASRDPATILAQFNRPDATMIGMPTGAASGFIVIDIDIKNGLDGRAWLKSKSLPTTRTHHTKSGGLHLVFNVPNGIVIRNSASKIAPGVDVRGEGGYVIIPPSPDYTVVDNVKVAEMPEWLIRACTYTKPPPPPPPNGHAVPRESYTKYTQAAIDGELRAVTSASAGTRNDALNKAAFSLGTLVGAGQMSRSKAEMLLQQAGHASGLPPIECVKTIKSGLDSGEQHPREMPERPARHNGQTNGQAHSGTTQKPIIEIIRYADVEAVIDSADLIENLLGSGTMSVVYGESNSGKTFFATNIAFHVANGWEWNGRYVERLGVIYCAMEGAYGIRNRIAALKIEYGIEIDVPLGIVTAPLDLCISKKDTENLIDAIKAEAIAIGFDIGLIIIDTVARAMAGGNENAPDDMGSLVKNGDRIRAETNAHVMWIHHSGKDQARGARGHSSLRAATDTEIEVSAEGGFHTARVTKQREYECTGEFNFRLKVVEIGQTKRGKALTSCVVMNDDERSRKVPSGRLSGHERRAFEVLDNLAGQTGQTGHSGVPSGYRSVPEKWWRDRFYQDAMPGDDQDTKQKAFRRAASSLMEKRLVGMVAGRVWVCLKNEAQPDISKMSGMSGLAE